MTLGLEIVQDHISISFHHDSELLTRYPSFFDQQIPISAIIDPYGRVIDLASLSQKDL